MSFVPGTDLETLLASITDALVRGQRLQRRFSESELRQASVFLPILRTLTASYRPVRADRRYAARLRHELMDRPYTMVDRVRYLPPRVQLAAASVAVLGAALVLLQRSRLPRLQEPPALSELPGA
jgi:hypothetical protein